MKKLYQLKEWLTIDDTARHLTILFGENVSEADVLRLGLDGHIKLSIYIVNGAVARLGQLVEMNKAKFSIMPSDTNSLNIADTIQHLKKTFTLDEELPDNLKQGISDKTLQYFLKGIMVSENQVLELDDEFELLSVLQGIYDIPMLGGDRLDIEHKYQMKTDGGVAVTGTFLDGAFVVCQDGKLGQLQVRHDDSEERKNKPLYHRDNYYPARGLPDDSILVVRTKELRDFESKLKRLDNETYGSSVPDKERESMLKIILALAKNGYSYPNHGTLKDMVDDFELKNNGVSEKTLKKYLDQATRL